MDASQIVSALNALCPGAQWSLQGNDLSGLQWLDTKIAQPTTDSINAYVAANPTPVPKSVTPRQARLALLNAGLLDKVEALVQATGGATQITWDYASSFDRSNPLLAAIGTNFNLSSAQIDALFMQAATY